MTDLTPLPSRRLTLFFRVAAWLWGVALATWIFFGLLWGSINVLIVPRIDQYREQLEIHASKVIGLPVRIGSISAKTFGMVPSFDLRQVELLDPKGEVALRLPRVLVALSPRSLLRKGFEQLYIDQPALTIKRTMQGDIWVGGLEMSQSQDPSSDFIDWIASQLEINVHQGSVTWIDEMRGAAPLVLNKVDAVIRNQGRAHSMRLDATPPSAWGDRMTWRGQFKHPFITAHPGRFNDWKGEIYAELSQIDLSELHRYVDLGLDLKKGKGRVIAWADISEGQISEVLGDLEIQQLELKAAKDLKPLKLRSIDGRLAGRWLPRGFELHSTGLKFDTDDGLHWPGGLIKLRYESAGQDQNSFGSFTADQINLEALSQVITRLPVNPAVQKHIAAYGPKGLVSAMKGSWQGGFDNLHSYALKGVVNDLTLGASSFVGGGGDKVVLGALKGAKLEFDFSQSGGVAKLGINKGELNLPRLFSPSNVGVLHFESELQWQIKGKNIYVQVPHFAFENADIKSKGHLKWESGNAINSASIFPGKLDLEVEADKFNLDFLNRYQSQTPIPDWRLALNSLQLKGRLSNATLKVKGALNHFPFKTPQQGLFSLTTELDNVDLVFPVGQPKGKNTLAWPDLKDILGRVETDGIGFKVKIDSARLASNLRVVNALLELPQLNGSQARVLSGDIQIKGPLQQVVDVMKASPVRKELPKGWANLAISKGGDLQTKFSFPWGNPKAFKLDGRLIFQGNTLRVNSVVPPFENLRGTVQFSEKTFQFNDVKALLLGGGVNIEGGTLVTSLTPVVGSRSIEMRLSGVAYANNLESLKDVDGLSGLARYAIGELAYKATLGVRSGELEWSLQSDLKGLGLNLPAPLNKDVNAILPLSFQRILASDINLVGQSLGPALQDRVRFAIGDTVIATYERDLSFGRTRVMRGAVDIGLRAVDRTSLPDNGVNGYLSLDNLDVDAWQEVVDIMTKKSKVLSGGSVLSSVQEYFPNALAVQARELKAADRFLHNLVAGGTREGSTWKVNLSADELNGYIEYDADSEGGAGKVFARLDRLNLAERGQNDVESLLTESATTTMPALDVVANAFELRGKNLGSLEVQATNKIILEGGQKNRQWLLETLKLITPEARLVGTGRWRINPKKSAGFEGNRQMTIDFDLTLSDSGKFLDRLGMKGVVSKGEGNLKGEVSWRGSPFKLDYPSMNGAFTVDVTKGQFLKVEEGLGKLLGVLSLQSLPRRLTLDFRDVFSEGFAFDFVRGYVRVEKGIAKTNNLQMKGVSAGVLLEGEANISKETQSVRVIVVPEINAGSVSLIASIINPVVGLSSFLAQYILRTPLIDVNTKEFQIEGSWSDPEIKHIEPTENREK